MSWVGVTPSSRSIWPRLVDLEHVHAHRPTLTAAFVYELAFDGDPSESRRFLTDLVGPTILHDPDSADGGPSNTNRSEPEAGRSGPGQGDPKATDPQVNGHVPAPEAADERDSTAPATMTRTS